MNIEEAILAHARWRIRLASYMRSPNHSIDITQLRAKDKCDLGRWLYGEGAIHRSKPEYEALEKAHAQFHQIAANLAQKAELMQIPNIDSALSAGSEFGHASTLIVNNIKALANKIG